ncbi:MAG: dienelactone hydrolase family protein [Nitrospinae bacterium]|nr:dienelactone hydrolase family protein [Nitrospinota bacterium]
MKLVLALVSIMFLGLADNAHAKVIGTEVSYKDGDTALKGYIAYDDAVKGKRPGVLVVHEWWGHVAYARKRADMLAQLGYTALALDMYGDGKTAAHPDEAGKFSAMVSSNLPLMKSRFLAARALLNAQPTVDASRNGAIGYCFGGGVVLAMAREGLDLRGVAVFHGHLPGHIKAQKGAVKAKVMVANGADDPFQTAEQVAAFKQEMADAAVDLRFFSYPGAVHSFTNPEATEYGKQFKIPLAYNEQADKASWSELAKFFKEVFAK